MFTVLTITGTNSVVEFSIQHFTTLAAAQAHNPQGINCTVENIILEGQLSESEAIAEYLS